MRKLKAGDRVVCDYAGDRYYGTLNDDVLVIDNERWYGVTLVDSIHAFGNFKSGEIRLDREYYLDRFYEKL